jgi:uncharacterized protein (TIGR00255 family)
MTAYAGSEKIEQELSIHIEMRSYNSRHLDISIRLPHGFAGLEEKVKGIIASQLVRGRIEVRIWVKDTSEKACAFEVDTTKARAFHTAVQRLKEQLNLAGEMSLDRLIDVNGIIQPCENAEAVDEYWPLIEETLTEGLGTLEQMRLREGSHIGEDFDQRLAVIEAHLDRIERGAEGLPALYRERLTARIEALTKGVVELDPVRVAQEAAILADRSDISEEIVRARSHIVQFRSFMTGPEPAGRKLNFLLQEFNREFNTMGSKIGQADLAHLVVAVKAEIEKLREQVQNIE